MLNCPRVPWFNDEIKEAKRKRRKTERKWRRSKSTIDLDNFKRSRNTVNHILFKARQHFYSDLIDEHSGDQKKLFRTTMNLLNRAGTQRLPLVPGSIMFANNIGNYFIGKIENIRKKLDAIPGLSSGSDKSPENTSTMTEFNILTEEDVILLIKNSSLKSCTLDPMPSRLVSECSSLLPVLTKIINSSLQNGHFPKTWKDAMVFPLLKKIGVDFALDNLRPVSNLKFVSKLTEMAACNQVHSHVSANNLYPSLQSSYRKGHSTETALLKIVNDILLNMNKQHVTLLVLLDLSAAFNTVDHDILIQRLTTKFGINRVVLNWFKSHLEGRSQHVSVQGSVSEKFDLKWGVP